MGSNTKQLTQTLTNKMFANKVILALFAATAVSARTLPGLERPTGQMPQPPVGTIRPPAGSFPPVDVMPVLPVPPAGSMPPQPPAGSLPPLQPPTGPMPILPIPPAGSMPPVGSIPPQPAGTNLVDH